ncbi:MFS transporter [Arcticibacterium luteifluviistationis]|uniref:MFS transporter n=1 Tax=Arcticibacterium luteifluviistationis TaxID=1784714 RepID=A0A2Z4GC75_9BACT|nr:MFS transporter [Arcticibacterium luteifluviistationis]AWV98899.1 MFS transporter [Arcticibacterium luteifluviistationis]
MDFSPSVLIDKSQLTKLQYGTIFICFLMNMLDGMDVLVISYTAPAIAKAWSISPQTLGIVFGSGLAGMTIGTLFLAPFADRIGRKSMILISGIIMGIAIYLTGFANSINELLVYRFLAGLGIGCMLASTAALTSEFTPNRSRNFWVSFVISGYPVGAVASGLVAAKVIPTQGWEEMYHYAGYASLISIPLIIFFLSESLEFYIKKQPKNALQKVNAILKKMDFDEITELPPKAEPQSAIAVGKLLSGKYKIPSLQLWLALFMAFGALFFMTSWIPKLATDAGLSMELAIYAGTVFNVGAFFGIVTQGYFSSKYGLKKTIGVILILTAVLMACFGLFVGSDFILLVFAFLGFGIQGGFVGLYAFAARMYPTEIKTTGIGWAMGAGRFGGIVGPALAGLLIGMGLTIGTNFLIFAIPALIAGIMTWINSSEDVS